MWFGNGCCNILDFLLFSYTLAILYGTCMYAQYARLQISGTVVSDILMKLLFALLRGSRKLELFKIL